MKYRTRTLTDAQMAAGQTVAVPKNIVSPGDGGFGVYVHWPFCKAKCPYCDFNSHVRHGGVDQKAFAQGLARELAHFAAIAPGRRVTSIFFGGGTPSLMEPATVAAVIEAIAALWEIDETAEISLEANPTSVEAERFSGYRTAGVNRVSLGVQSLDDNALRFLGRQHTAQEAVAAFEIARRNFDRVSFDLIYARPRQPVAEWRQELARALTLAIDHLSLYQLTIEPDTRFADLHRKGVLVVPDDDQARALYDSTQEACEAAGLPAYEISNHARPGAECRHNLVYWRYGEYAGVGPGAHARIADGNERLALSTERSPEAWLDQVERQGNGIVARETLSAAEQADEMMLMGLRLAEGADLNRFQSLAGKSPDPAVLEALRTDGLLDHVTGGDTERIRATKTGRPVLNALVDALTR